MAKVTVLLHVDGTTIPDEHEQGSEFAAVEHAHGTVLEVYSSTGHQIAAYAPGCWASAVIN